MNTMSEELLARLAAAIVAGIASAILPYLERALPPSGSFGSVTPPEATKAKVSRQPKAVESAPTDSQSDNKALTNQPAQG